MKPDPDPPASLKGADWVAASAVSVACGTVAVCCAVVVTKMLRDGSGDIEAVLDDCALRVNEDEADVDRVCMSLNDRVEVSSLESDTVLLRVACLGLDDDEML